MPLNQQDSNYRRIHRIGKYLGVAKPRNEFTKNKSELIEFCEIEASTLLRSSKSKYYIIHYISIHICEIRRIIYRYFFLLFYRFSIK
jgi:hypothetical protein